MHQANAAITNADFTFEALIASGTTTAGASFGSYAADFGTGTAYGVHAAAAATYSEPSGNGSLKSFSSNDWTAGDYYQFSVQTTGLANVIVSFDQIGSSTGAASFNLLYSTDGTNFTTFGGYSISLIAGSTSWSTSSSVAGYNHAFDLSAIPGITNDAGAVFRVAEATGSLAVNGGAIGTGGTDHVDNFVVSNTPVPEPASLSLLTVTAAGLLMRRRSLQD